MFEEAQYFAPVIEDADGAVHVELGGSHPGVHDAEYRRRRDDIAAAALRWQRGRPVPRVTYTDVEDGVWREVSRELALRHETHACAEFLAARELIALPTDRVPQLDEVTAALEPLTGFHYVPAAGLVPLRDFYGSLAERVFHSTQYIRHHSVPFYTPEPDLIHEVLGHATALASPRFAALYEAAGHAARRVVSDEALEFVSRVFWFTLEFGVVRESDELKAYGAGILSSFGEIEEYRSMDIRPLDLAAMAATEYDITTYQTVLFAADSFEQVEDVVGDFFATADDDTIAAMSAHATTA